jgi:hypothetical protein
LVTFLKTLIFWRKKLSDYLAWCEQVRYLPLNLPGSTLQSANKVKVVTLDGGALVLLKTIRPEVVYIPRIKILGEVAYSLFDYHLNPAERVTPNVCPISENTLWREFIQGLPGDVWRGKIYKETKSLEVADLVIVDQILSNRFAQRIALLDFIFLCQDHSARNWIKDKNRFWAVDNGMFWAYKGRYADKETVRTRKVDHLNHPMEALVSHNAKFSFQIGLFSSLHAGRLINDGLLAWLYQVDWRQYLQELSRLISVLGYSFSIISDWRFKTLGTRKNWLLENRRFPTVPEAFGDEWQKLIDQPEGGEEVWKIEWETENLETG